MDVGATLRRAREVNRLTLEQLSRTTKISPASLRALENNDFDRLPANVYTRGFLRAYAREVHLDPEETVDQYMQQLDEAIAAQEAEAERLETDASTHQAPVGFTNDVKAQQGSAPRNASPVRIQIDLTSLPRPATLAAAVVLVGALIAVLVWRNENSRPTVTSAAEALPTDQAATPQPAANDVMHAANVDDATLQVELRTTGLCWVSLSADRAHVFARLMQANEIETVEAKDGIIIRVGDPSTLNVTVNGKPLRPLGRQAVPVTVAINRETLRELLGS